MTELETTAGVVATYRPEGASRDTTVSERTLGRMEASVPESTRRAYTGDWKRFEEWCAEQERTAFPATAETLAEYTSHLADKGKAPATISRALSSIRVYHHFGGQEVLPSLKPALKTLTGYRGERADAELPNSRPASALAVAELRTASKTLNPEDIRQLRDRVVLVLTWAMMARRSTMARLAIGDVARVAGGLDVTVRKSKTDQEAKGRIVAVPYGSDPVTCPVRTTLMWIAALADLGIASGPLLRNIDKHGHVAGQPGARPAGRRSSRDGLSVNGINDIIQRVGEAAGIEIGRLTAHSLRAGGASGAHLGGADMLTIARHGGWADGSAALLGYIRDVDRWEKNPMYKAGL